MPQVFVWGEPFGHAGLIDALARPLSAISDTWPPGDFFDAGHTPAELSRQFIANLYPSPQALLDAHRAFFQRLFTPPAQRTGEKAWPARWGLKEVRLTADHAAYLKWLYPRAKILFLVRNPWDAYRSYAARAQRGEQWYARWPDEPITPKTFARYWRTLAAGFFDRAEELGALLVRYESLARGEYGPIEEYLGFTLHRAAGETNPESGMPRPLAAMAPRELEDLRAELGGVPEQFGYERPPVAGREIESRSLPPKEKCVVLVPTMAFVEPQCEESLRVLEARGYTVRRLRGHSQIDVARSRMASDALLDGFEETLWIDADVAFDPEAVEKLRSHGRALVCGIYPKKGPRALSCHLLPGTRRVVFGQEGGLLEIRYAATGFLLVRRQVYEDMRHQLGLPWCNERFGRPLAPFFHPLIEPDGVGQWYLSEDYSFCERARRCGYQIWADTTIRLRHLGQYGYTWEDAGGGTPRYDTYYFDVR